MKLDTLYLVHHSHTDVGYTADQPVFWELQHRFIRDALDLIDQHRQLASEDPDSAFRWTVETTCQLQAFLDTASPRDVERFVRAEKEGFIEVMAMFANLTPLADANQVIETLKPVAQFRAKYGFDIRYAMNCDVNGQNWILPDLLLDHGIEAYSMAINQHFGGAPDRRPEVFLWQAPSGRTLPTLNGWQYSKANDFGLGDDDDAKFRGLLPHIEAHLEANGVTFPFFLLQGFHPFGDNGTAWDGFARFARRWNQAGYTPRLVIATPRMFWQRLAGHRADLPTRRGDWTDYWNFGAGSTARETSVYRTSRARLQRADTLAALIAAHASHEVPLDSRRTMRLYRDAAWRELNLYAEHTWGGDEASNHPETDDSLAMENHKKQTAWKARSLSLLLERDALGDLARLVDHEDPLDLLVFNHLPWPRKVSGSLGRNSVMPRGLLEDGSASRHFQGRNEQPIEFWTGREGSSYNGNFGLVMPPVDVPAFGWAVVPAGSLEFMGQAEVNQEHQIETTHFHLRFDPETGALLSLVEKSNGNELVDGSCEVPFLGVVHEEVADRNVEEPRKEIFHPEDFPLVDEWRGWKPEWQAKRTWGCGLVTHEVYRLSFQTVIEQVLEHERLGRVRRRLVLPDHVAHLEVQSEWQMGTDVHPEATYVAFGFALPGAQPRFDSGPAAVKPEHDQLAGSCRDYFTTQGWVDFNNGQRGLAVATPENPLIQLGDFHFGQNQHKFALERPLLLGWVTNSYWETNFPGRQPGTVVSRYVLLPYQGGFDPPRVSVFAQEVAHARPVAQLMGEAPFAADRLPSTGGFLTFESKSVDVLGLRSVGGQLEVDLYNPDSAAAQAHFGSQHLALGAAQQVSFVGTPLATPEVIDQAADVSVAAGRLARVRLTLLTNSSERTPP